MSRSHPGASRETKVFKALVLLYIIVCCVTLLCKMILHSLIG